MTGSSRSSLRLRCNRRCVETVTCRCGLEALVAGKGMAWRWCLGGEPPRARVRGRVTSPLTGAAQRRVA